jgi:hypothetical protein
MNVTERIKNANAELLIKNAVFIIAPEEVKQVAKAWQENAMQAAEYEIKEGQSDDDDFTIRFWENRLYMTLYDTDKGQRWGIGDNYEKAATMVYYSDPGEWYWMVPYGEECLMKGGFDNAIGSAKVMWTG